MIFGDTVGDCKEETPKKQRHLQRYAWSITIYPWIPTIAKRIYRGQ